MIDCNENEIWMTVKKRKKERRIKQLYACVKYRYSMAEHCRNIRCPDCITYTDKLKINLLECILNFIVRSV